MADLVVPVHEPGKPRGHDPASSREDDFAGNRQERVSDPIATNFFSPGKDLASLAPRSADIFISPNLGSVPTGAPPQAQALTEIAAHLQEPFNLAVKAEYIAVQEVLQRQKERARTCSACLPDYLNDVVTTMKDQIALTQDDANRTAYESVLVDFYTTRSNLLRKLFEWDTKRREYPYDWASLAKLQNELNNQLIGSLSLLKRMESTTDFTSPLRTAISIGLIGCSAIAFELGRQGAELTHGSRIFYGSASEAVSETLVIDTGQNKLAASFRDAIDKDALAEEWKKLILLPKFSSAATKSYWEAATAAMDTALRVWSRVGDISEVDYADLAKKTGMFLDVVKMQQDDLSRHVNPDDPVVPDFLRADALTGLALLSDEIARRIRTLIRGANLEEAVPLQELLQRAKDLRGATSTESLAAKAADMGLAKFWGRSKDTGFDGLSGEVNEKNLKKSLADAFQESLSSLLDKWSAEMKKVPNHNPSALREATWKVRFTTRRYKTAVDRILTGETPSIRGCRSGLQQSLDAVQFAMAKRLRQPYEDGYFLFDASADERGGE